MTIVAPKAMRPPRIEPLAVLPVFFRLSGQRVVVAGTGAAVAWKAELAAAAGAAVDVYSLEPDDDLVGLASEPPAGTVNVITRDWTTPDLQGAVLVIGALEGSAAEALAATARSMGIPVNIVDTPALSTFNFGTIVNRSPVVIAISTDGTSPVLGQFLRSRIEALVHPALAAWAAAARGMRDAIKAKLEMGPARRAAWRRFAAAAMAARCPPVPGEIASLIEQAKAEGGSVALVGAGPGDPELITLKAMRALSSADVILYDRLVGPEILELARREASRILVGKAAGGVRCRQDDINGLMVRLALEGKRVVRLKGGDPLIFGRAAEEIDACRAAGVPVEIVPGITAALGAAAELLLPLTDRKLAKRLQIVTGHTEDGVAPDHDWPSLADPWATTVLYMGSRTLTDTLPKMLAAGLDPETPAVAVSAATTHRRVVVRCRAIDLPEHLARLDRHEPQLIMLGRSVAAFALGDEVSSTVAVKEMAESL